VVSVTPRSRFTPGKGPPIPIGQEAGWVRDPVWTERLEEKSFRLCRGWKLGRPVVQSFARNTCVLEFSLSLLIPNVFHLGCLYALVRLVSRQTHSPCYIMVTN
jgi:hypothetical protein